MKKFYFLSAVLASAFAFAQGVENFEKQTALVAAYADGSFDGETAGVKVNYVHSRNEGTGTADDYAIEGKGIMLRRSDEPSSVEFVIPNGVGTFTFSYRKAFTSGVPRVAAVFVDGVQTTVVPEFGEGSGVQSTVFTSTTEVKKAGIVKIKISFPTGTSAGNKQFTVDKVSWTAPNLSTVDFTEAAKSLENTVWTNTASFSSKGKSTVEVYNLNGQLVKSFSVEGKQAVNVSDLTKGIYVVKTTNEGVTLTTKVVKK